MRLSSPMSLSLGLMLSALFSPIGAAAQDQPSAPPVVGTWAGKLDVGNGMQLRLVFHVTAEEDGSLAGTMDSPDQGQTGLPLSAVTVTGDSVRFEFNPANAAFAGTFAADHQSIEGQWMQGPSTLPLTLTRSEDQAAPNRPQEPKPPFPYRSEDVTIPNTAAGVDLAGTLTLPRGEGPFPAAVLVTGSGPQDRNETLLGHKPFLVLADYLTRQGIAVLRYDDRGVGKSTGVYATATSEDNASDALAAVEFARSRPEIAGDKVGIVGHSEGGLIGPMVAARSPDVAFVVMLAGPGLPGRQILTLQGQLINRAAGTPEAIIQHNTDIQNKLFDIVEAEPDPKAAAPKLLAALKEAVAALPPEARAQAPDQTSDQALEAQVAQVNSPWMRFFLTYDPRPTLEKVKVPVLALDGEKDLQVPPKEDLAEIAAALHRGGNKDVTTELLPGLNHLFQHATTGSPSEYAHIEETFAPEAMKIVSSWILARFGPGS
ncbi:MAG: alpha/beta hydrolase [Gemmatimonadetes bacterium]|nr:alpha/beta hydrolase [Gemmatimonadota bacterium]